MSSLSCTPSGVVVDTIVAEARSRHEGQVMSQGPHAFLQGISVTEMAQKTLA
jgi:hypothetical protein